MSRVTWAGRLWPLVAVLMVGLAGAAPASATTYTQAAHSGSWYAATSTATGGGGTYEDVALSTSAGDLVCSSAWVRTQYPATGGSGAFVIWLLGGAGAESGTAGFSGLSNLGNWTEVHACAEATSSHPTLRVQFYPTPGSPTVDMDDIDVHRSLAVNGGFENGGGAWAPYPGTSSNFVVYAAGASAPAHGGSHFAATNTASAGGGIYQDVALSTSAGSTVCASAWVRTEGSGSGASGSMALFLLGGGAADSSSAGFSGLPAVAWSPIHSCVEATGSHTTLRIQFYPTPGGATVELDDVDVTQSVVANGSFESGGGPWAPYPGTGSNFVVYAAGPSAPAGDGGHFAATNTTAAGGGIYEDIALDTAPGQLVCGSALVRTEGAAGGASGSMALFLLGTTAADSSDAAFTGLPAVTWTPIQTCVEATGSHATLRVQFYPTPGGPTVDLDDVEAHTTLAANGGFEYGSGPWGTYPNTDSSFDVEKTGVVTAPATPVTTTPTSTTLPRPRSRHSLRIRLALTWTWRYAISRLERATIGRFPHRTRLTVRCTGHGCSGRRRAAADPRAIHRLLAGLRGNRYRVGDRLQISFTARGWRPERAEIEFRYGRLPVARLLGR